MRPGTFIEWDDQSQIQSLEIKEVRESPVFCAVGSTDKGPEGWTLLSGKDWFKTYGENVSFAAHGQPLLQTAMSINSGATMLFKRLVADDATLANAGIVATIVTEDVQKTNTTGDLLYLDADGNETTDEQRKDGEGNLLYLTSDDQQTTDQQKKTATGELLYLDSSNNETTESQKKDNEGNLLYVDENGVETTTADGNQPALNAPILNQALMNDPVMVQGASSIRYSIKSARDKATLEEAVEEIKASLTDDEYLLWVIADNGRGKSNKRFKILPNYRLSKNLKYILYAFVAIEDGNEIETIYFTPNPNQVTNNENISLMNMINTKSTQFVAYEDENGLNNFLTKVAEISGADQDDSGEVYDYIFCYNRKNRPMANISVDTENALDLKSNFGQAIINGSNGSFGDKPWWNARDLYNEQAVKALNGSFDKNIYDVDRYFIDAFIDANYDQVVKSAITALAIYREDFLYFRDMGTDMYSLEDVVYGNMDNVSSMFCASYCTAYAIRDPYTFKQIEVTITYDIARILPQHLNNGFNLPCAGIRYGFVLNDAIPGTVRFLPSVTPELDEKNELNDLRVNYASYLENNLVLETLYTSQEAYTQWSFINNVMSTQKVIKAIRRRCPITRYSFIDGDDLDIYRKDVDNVLERYRTWFKELEMVYVEDPAYVINKIFYACIKVIFRDFVQTELFKITAINSTTTLS